jgi:hypothetical protein
MNLRTSFNGALLGAAYTQKWVLPKTGPENAPVAQ